MPAPPRIAPIKLNRRRASGSPSPQRKRCRRLPVCPGTCGTSRAVPTRAAGARARPPSSSGAAVPDRREQDKTCPTRDPGLGYAAPRTVARWRSMRVRIRDEFVIHVWARAGYDRHVGGRSSRTICSRRGAGLARSGAGPCQFGAPRPAPPRHSAREAFCVAAMPQNRAR
jgi:hypothetical protein